MEKKKTTRGGARPGTGPKPLPPDKKRVPVSMRIRADQYQQIKGNVTKEVEAALDDYLKIKRKKWWKLQKRN